MTTGLHPPGLHGPGGGGGGGGGGGAGRFLVGAWRAVNLLANFNTVINRATGQSTAVILPRSRLVGFTCSMDNVGLSNGVTGTPMLIKVVRVSAAGVADAPVTIGSLTSGQSNVTRDSLVPILFEAGDSVYVQLTTDAGWTNLTCDPTIQLELERR